MSRMEVRILKTKSPNKNLLNFGTVFLIVVKSRILRKANFSSLLVGEENSMVFTYHSVPFPATRDLRSLVAGLAPLESLKPFHFLHTSDGKQILIS